jgi:hypothetical protein
MIRLAWALTNLTGIVNSVSPYSFVKLISSSKQTILNN